MNLDELTSLLAIIKEAGGPYFCWYLAGFLDAL